MLMVSFFVPKPQVQVALLAGGLTLAFMSMLLVANALRTRRLQTAYVRQLVDVIANDPSPGFVTDLDGLVLGENAAAREQFTFDRSGGLGAAVGDLFANPAAVVFRLQNRAQALGSAREDIVTRRGHMRLSVHTNDTKNYLWRLEEIGGRIGVARGADTSSLPMLTAGKTGTILYMNDAFRKLVGGRMKSLDRIFNALPIQSGAVNEITTTQGPMQTMVAEIDGGMGKREIYLLPGQDPNRYNAEGWPNFDDIPVPLLKISAEGYVESANRLARGLLDEDLSEPVPFSDLVEGLGRSVADWLSEAVNGHGKQHAEILRARKPEKEVFLQVTLNRIVQENTPHLIAVLNDATEFKTLEKQFVQSQKMQAIGQLAGGVAHDFNNLLTAISGHCDLLLLRHDQGDPDYADLVQINQNANRAASLVGQLLAFSRKQNLRPETIDLCDTLSDLAHLLNRLVGEKVLLSLTHDPDLPTIRADKRQLEQVLMNLVVNARDAMPDGGEIRVETLNKTLREPMERDRAVVPAGDYVVVSVSDEGVGIPEDKLQKIFEPFFTTKRVGEGTGLGLSTAYGIVKQSGGFIFVDTVVGSGTSFTLYFPAFDAVIEPVADKVKEKTTLAKSGEGVVLLVEDEAPVRAFASRALRMRGYTVLEAECAEDALETLEDKELNVDIFVTDVIMPGMDGPSWVRQARQERPDVKVVFVSGYAEEDFTDNQSQIPNSVFLPKPFSLSELMNTVQEQLH